MLCILGLQCYLSIVTLPYSDTMQATAVLSLSAQFSLYWYCVLSVTACMLQSRHFAHAAKRLWYAFDDVVQTPTRQAGDIQGGGHNQSVASSSPVLPGWPDLRDCWTEHVASIDGITLYRHLSGSGAEATFSLNDPVTLTLTLNAWRALVLFIADSAAQVSRKVVDSDLF